MWRAMKPFRGTQPVSPSLFLFLLIIFKDFLKFTKEYMGNFERTMWRMMSTLGRPRQEMAIFQSFRIFCINIFAYLTHMKDVSRDHLEYV